MQQEPIFYAWHTWTYHNISVINFCSKPLFKILVFLNLRIDSINCIPIEYTKNFRISICI